MSLEKFIKNHLQMFMQAKVLLGCIVIFHVSSPGDYFNHLVELDAEVTDTEPGLLDYDTLAKGV